LSAVSQESMHFYSAQRTAQFHLETFLQAAIAGATDSGRTGIACGVCRLRQRPRPKTIPPTPNNSRNGRARKMLRHGMLGKTASTIGVCALLLSAIAQPSQACTGIRLVAKDGTVVYARTLEFGIDLQSEVLMVPRGYARTGTTPDGKEGLKWKA